MSEPTGGWALPEQPGPARMPPPAAGQPAGWSAVSDASGAAAQPVGAPPAWSGGSAAWDPNRSAAPAPRPGVVPLRPLGVGELLDGGVRVVRGYPGPALGVAAAVALVATAVQLLITLLVVGPATSLDTAALQAGNADQLAGVLAGASVAAAVGGLLSVVTGALLTGFLTAITGRAVLGQPLTLSELWPRVRSCLGRLIGVALLTALLVAAGPVVAGVVIGLLAVVSPVAAGVAAVVLVPAAVVALVLAYVRLSLATSAVVLEGAGVRLALRRSWRLTARAFWRVLGVLLLTALITSLVGQVLALPFTLLAGGGGLLSGGGLSAGGLGARQVVLGALGTGVAALVSGPFTAAVRALLYVDRRMRAEGLDVALRTAAGTTA